ncbi:MAG TPA: hypothetical protein DFS52_27020, partial [Myxococcales bacterium]|nr:hypothetical protein [Myxococcales bacterium]
MSDREPTPAALSLRSGAALALAALAGGAIAAGAIAAWRRAGPSAVGPPPAARADPPGRGRVPADSGAGPAQALWTQVGAGAS